LSETDREKWNTRYRAGAYTARSHPSELLVQWLPRLEVSPGPLHAIDIACGSGRNSLYLARHGWQVDGVDISEVALEQLGEKARIAGLPVACINADLERDDEPGAGFLRPDHYELAIMFRYAHAALVKPLEVSLKPGGYLIVESHLVTDADVIGPRGARHRVGVGELQQASSGMEVLLYSEGIVTDPDGSSAALARLVARKASG
jgi:SAM-dependent methyltransferase